MFKPFHEYRWDIPRLWPFRIRDAASDIWYGIKNTIRWAPVIWFDADFDWEFLANVMEYKLRRMSKGFATSRITLGWHDQSKQTIVCAELIKRLREDNYHENAEASDLSNKALNRKGEYFYVKRYMANQKADEEYLFKLMAKYWRHWWD